MIRSIPVPTCAQCPYRQNHYGNYECSKFNFQVLPAQAIMNGKGTSIPDWCPLPPHPSFARDGRSLEDIEATSKAEIEALRADNERLNKSLITSDQKLMEAMVSRGNLIDELAKLKGKTA